MDDQPQRASWEAPAEEAGPAPGVEFAPYGERLIAYVIDLLIVTIVIGIFATFFGLLAVGAFNQNATALLTVTIFGVVFISLVLALGYFPFSWLRTGQTWGMRPFNLYVVRDRDGGPITGSQAALRLIGYWINSVTLYVGFAWILVDKRRRGWHDLIAGTVVVKR